VAEIAAQERIENAVSVEAAPLGRHGRFGFIRGAVRLQDGRGPQNLAEGQTDLLTDSVCGNVSALNELSKRLGGNVELSRHVGNGQENGR
jgi:hypothetical protein